MNAPVAQQDLRVREHFNTTTELYIDVHRELGQIICRERLDLLHQAIAQPFDADLRLLDLGCGGGAFTDLFLSTYPNGLSVALDASEGMLRRNIPTAGKHLLIGDARILPLRPGHFDVINLDAVLHHVLDAGGYDATIANLRATVEHLGKHLRPGGVIAIREIYHEFWGYETLGTRLIHFVSTRGIPRFMERWLKAAGLKTANVGVCFLSRSQWAEVFHAAGFCVTKAFDKRWSPSWIRWIGFRRSGEMHYVLTSLQPSRGQV